MGVAHEGTASVAHRKYGFAAGHRAQPFLGQRGLALGTQFHEQGNADCGGGDHGFGQGGSAGFFEHQHKVALIHAEPIVVLGDEQAGHADF